MGAIRQAIVETLKSPFTYVGSAAVGLLSWLASSWEFGVLVPFVVPFFVQAFARYVASKEATSKRGREEVPR